MLEYREAIQKMEKIADKYFSTYTIQINIHCDGDYTIEAIHIPETGYAHKFIYREMTSPPIYEDLDISENTVVEAMMHPEPGGGLGHQKCVECQEGLGHYAVAGNIRNLYKN